ncbi:hypothetical protein AHAS_Ahas17G0248000 [Arachis hypogaea]
MMDMDVVYMEVVVLGSNWVGIRVDLCMAHMAHRVVDMVDKGWNHVIVFGNRGLVSMVVQSCVEEVVHKHMVGLVGKGVHHIHHLGTLPGMALDHSNLVEVGCHEEIHHNYCLGVHCRVVVVHGILEGVVTERVDQILVVPFISDCSDLGACSCYSFHSFQQYWNQTQSDGGENS